MADIFIGNVKGPQGETGATGSQGPKGDAATIEVGSVTTTAYGNPARVTNSGTSSEAVFDFVIPQGRPGEQTTKIDNLTIDAITEPATQFPVPAVGDNGSTLFGKISKWFSDMAALVASKFDASNVVNNLTTTSSGYALDARQGKTLNDDLTTLSGRLSWKSLGNTSGGTSLPITLPDDFQEIHVMATVNNNSISMNNLFIRGHVGASERQYQIGYYLNGNLNGCLTFGVSSTSVRVVEAWINGTNVLSGVAAFWTYR